MNAGTPIAKMNELNNCYISKQINDTHPPTTQQNADSDSKKSENIGRKRIRRKKSENIRIRQIQVKQRS